MQSLSNSMVFIGAALIVTGVLLFVSDRVKKGRKNERTATWLDVLIVGLGQAIATMPGISRSGMTITTGCFVGFERKFAVRFSFLLSIPAVLGANILSLADAAKAGINWAEVPVYLVGVVTAAVGIPLHPPAAFHRRPRQVRRVCLLLLGRRRADAGAERYQVKSLYIICIFEESEAIWLHRRKRPEKRPLRRRRSRRARPPRGGGFVCLLLARCACWSAISACRHFS